jgi:hypothetical protein
MTACGPMRRIGLNRCWGEAVMRLVGGAAALLRLSFPIAPAEHLHGQRIATGRRERGPLRRALTPISGHLFRFDAQGF